MSRAPSLSPAKPPIGLMGRMRDGLFGLIVVGGLIAVLAFFARKFAFDHVDEEIRAGALKQLVAIFPGKHIELESARLVENEGIALRGLTVQMSEEEGGEEAGEVHIDEIFAASKVDLQQLMTSPIKIDLVRVRGVDLFLSVDSDWKETLAKLLPQSTGEVSTPPAEISEVRVELHEKASGKSVEFRVPTLVVTDNALAPSHLTELASQSRRRSAGSKAKKELLAKETDSAEPVKAPRIVSEIERGLAFRGVVESKWCRAIDFTGRIDPAVMAWEIEGNVETLEVNSALLESLPFLQLAPHLAATRLQGKTAFDFHASSKPSGDLPITFGVSGRIFDGKVDDPRLALPLVSVAANFDATSEGASITDASAEMGESKLKGSVH
jgi:hypothetical protein